jgi:hypothetical protein
MKDKNSKAIFDDFTTNEEGFETEYWTQICDSCYKKLNLNKKYVDENAGSGICGVKGCSNESDHYYDFNPEEWYINYYKCPECGNQWNSENDCCCNDKCRDCLTKDVRPYKSKETKNNLVHICIKDEKTIKE